MFNPHPTKIHGEEFQELERLSPSFPILSSKAEKQKD
jgi:hypothetical protein